MSINCVNSSLLADCLRKLRRGHMNLENAICEIYRNGCVNRSAKILWRGTKTNFRYSFLGRITETDDSPRPDILKNSKFSGWLLKKYSGLTREAGKSVVYAKTMNCAWSLKQELYLSLLKNGGLMAVTAIGLNTALSLLLGKEISWFGWIMRALFFSLGLICLFSGVDWKILNGTSRALAFLREKEKQINL